MKCANYSENAAIEKQFYFEISKFKLLDPTRAPHVLPFHAGRERDVAQRKHELLAALHPQVGRVPLVREHRRHDCATGKWKQKKFELQFPIRMKKLFRRRITTFYPVE